MLVYRTHKLAVIEAKAWDEALTEGVGQAKNYAEKLTIRFTYSTNGQGIYGIELETGKEGETPSYPTPDTLWHLTFVKQNAWHDRFATVPFEDKGGSHPSRNGPPKPKYRSLLTSTTSSSPSSTSSSHNM